MLARMADTVDSRSWESWSPHGTYSSVATITEERKNYDGSRGYKLQGASCGRDYYKEAQVSVQVTALTAMAAGGHVEVVLGLEVKVPLPPYMCTKNFH